MATDSTPKRFASIVRNTRETQIEISINLDGSGVFQGASGLGFFDHMLTLLARHGGFDLTLKMTGDLEVECHHAVEDAGIALGQILREAAGDKKGIQRFGQASIPMEETIVHATLDFCGRPYLYWGIGPFDRPMIGEYATEITEDFFRALTAQAGITLHLECPRGRNSHHIIEAVFKAFAIALRRSLAQDPLSSGRVPSTKGTL